MSATRGTAGLMAFLGALSLAAGFAAGRLREAPAPEDVSDSSVSREERAALEDETPTEAEARTAFEAPAEAKTPPSDVVDPAAEPDDPAPHPELAGLEEIAELVESLKDATSEEISRLRWNDSVRAALDRLRASVPGVYPVDSGLPPAVLAELTAALLARAQLPLTEEQRSELAELAAANQSEIERRLGALGDDALALERELCVVHALDELLEGSTALLDDRQRQYLDSAAPAMLEWPPVLSPLTGAPVRWHELETDAIPALGESLSRDLAREFGLDPEVADGFASRLVTDFERLLRFPPRRGGVVEQVVAFGEVQARILRELLAHPAVDEAARRRIRAQRGWMVLVPAG